MALFYDRNMTECLRFQRKKAEMFFKKFIKNRFLSFLCNMP